MSFSLAHKGTSRSKGKQRKSWLAESLWNMQDYAAVARWLITAPRCNGLSVTLPATARQYITKSLRSFKTFVYLTLVKLTNYLSPKFHISVYTWSGIKVCWTLI